MPLRRTIYGTLLNKSEVTRIVIMAYIYKITNDINDKVYVGKTKISIERRFSQHCRERKKERCRNRPLYIAMNKYGVEHFHVELIEETDNPEEREMYWIDFYNSYHYGYNATRGGDGKCHVDKKLVVDTYKRVKNQKQTAKILNISADTVRKILNSLNVKKLTSSEILRKKCGISVNQYDLEGHFLRKFDTVGDAVLYLNKRNNNRSPYEHILDVCRGKRKTAYGYVWTFVDDEI